MKTTIIINDDGTKQIMFTPENDSEKQALRMITPDDNIELAVKEGSLHSTHAYKRAGYEANMCEGGYLRVWDSEDSIMLVLTNKKDLPKPK